MLTDSGDGGDCVTHWWRLCGSMVMVEIVWFNGDDGDYVTQW